MKHLVSFFIFAALLTSCHKRAPVAAVPPPAPLPAPAPAEPPPSTLNQADAAFTAGNYAEAMRAYDAYLQRLGSADLPVQALFRLALSYALSPVPDWERATTLFTQVVEQYPQSPQKPAAAVILALRNEMTALGTDSFTRDQRILQLTSEMIRLQAEVATLNADSQKRDQLIKQLTTELNKLKQIDAERRKKP